MTLSLEYSVVIQGGSSEQSMAKELMKQEDLLPEVDLLDVVPKLKLVPHSDMTLAA